MCNRNRKDEFHFIFTKSVWESEPVAFVWESRQQHTLFLVVEFSDCRQWLCRIHEQLGVPAWAHPKITLHQFQNVFLSKRSDSKQKWQLEYRQEFFCCCWIHPVENFHAYSVLCRALWSAIDLEIQSGKTFLRETIRDL